MSQQQRTSNIVELKTSLRPLPRIRSFLQKVFYSHVFEEDAGHMDGVVLAPLQRAQEVARVERVDLLHVAEDDVALAAQRLWHVVAQQLGEVVLDDELQRAHVVALRLQHLAHHQRQVPAQRRERQSEDMSNRR